MLENYIDGGEENLGHVVRYWRKEVIRWNNTQTIVDLYNEALGDIHPVTIRWWQRMEQNNKVPTDTKRRWVVATLLHMPPAYFGLTTLPPILPQEPLYTPPSTIGERIDLAEYDEQLRDSWSSSYPRKDTMLRNALAKIHALEKALLYGPSDRRKFFAPMLCNYLLLAGNTCRDQGYTSAFSYLDKAVALAQEGTDVTLLAKTLYLRGYTHLDWWTSGGQRKHLIKALVDLNKAQEVATSHGLDGAIKAAIYSELGCAQAEVAVDKQDRLEAIRTNDLAGKFVSLNTRRDPYFLHINQEWYYIDRAAIFLTLNWPQSAQEELSQVRKGDAHKKRRYLTADVMSAEALIASDQIEIGVEYAIQALVMAKEVQAYLHIVDTQRIYDKTRANPRYTTHPDVARLGLELLKVRLPELFSGD